MTLKNNRAPLLSIIKLYASSHHHMWIQTGVTVRKRWSWVVTSVTLTFDLWPWPFAWTSLLSLVITPENFMMIGWWEHSQKGVTDRRTDRQTDRQTDGRTDWTIHRAAWSQLKMEVVINHELVIWLQCIKSTTSLQNSPKIAGQIGTTRENHKPCTQFLFVALDHAYNVSIDHKRGYTSDAFSFWLISSLVLQHPLSVLVNKRRYRI